MNSPIRHDVWNKFFYERYEEMIKDSGQRKQMAGMVRDITDDKVDYSLALDGPLFERLAAHLTKGAKKYSKRNWMGAYTQEEYDRFRESFIRHSIQYLRGDTDEDHFAAVAFNLNGMEYVKRKLDAEKKTLGCSGGCKDCKCGKVEVPVISELIPTGVDYRSLYSLEPSLGIDLAKVQVCTYCGVSEGNVHTPDCPRRKAFPPFPERRFLPKGK